MKKRDLINRIAKLESINDQLLTELQYIDSLVRQIGFVDGIKTLKSAANEMLEEIENDTFDDDINPMAG